MKHAILIIAAFVAASLFAADSNPPRYEYQGEALVRMTQAAVDALVNPTWRLENGKAVLLSAAEEAALVPTLEENRARKIEEIKAKTAELTRSFDHGGKTFDLTVANQIRWKALRDAVVDGLVATPTSVTADDDTELSLADQAAVEAFYAAGVTAILTPVNQGKVLIAAAKAAVDQASLDAVVDSR